MAVGTDECVSGELPFLRSLRVGQRQQRRRGEAEAEEEEDEAASPPLPGAEAILARMWN